MQLQKEMQDMEQRSLLSCASVVVERLAAMIHPSNMNVNATHKITIIYPAAIGIILCICIVVIFTICNKLIKEDDLEF